MAGPSACGSVRARRCTRRSILQSIQRRLVTSRLGRPLSHGVRLTRRLGRAFRPVRVRVCEVKASRGRRVVSENDNESKRSPAGTIRGTVHRYSVPRIVPVGTRYRAIDPSRRPCVPRSDRVRAWVLKQATVRFEIIFLTAMQA